MISNIYDEELMKFTNNHNILCPLLNDFIFIVNTDENDII